MSDIAGVVNSQKTFFNSDQTKSVKFRIDMLQRLRSAIHENEDALLDALCKDLGKTNAEAYMTEIAMVYQELNEALKHVRSWSRPKRVRGTLGTFPSRNYVYFEPYGVTLILAPWNYPFNLSMSPLVDAMAAGNCAVIKCSKTSSHTAEVIRTLINSAFPEEYIYCVDAFSDYDEVVNQKYDYIFFTGSPGVGKKIMKAASVNLTPVSLELGGKSPCIIDETADLKQAAKRIAWGKFLNAGQTCVSIDYVLVHDRVKNAFIEELKKEINLRYPDAANNPDYPKIINQHHFERLSALIDTEKDVIGGERNEEDCKIAPAILPEAAFDHEIMKEEIFGPLLPVIGYDDQKDVVHMLKELEKPLACYIFTSDKKTADRLIHSLSYGGGCVNDVILQITNHHMPFGGVGNSGIGHYHGKYGFETFSHKKGVVRSMTFADVPIRYAPFNERKLKLFRILFK